MSPNCTSFQCKDLLLDHDSPKKLVQCRWRTIKPSIYMIYRMVLTLYTIIICIYASSIRPKYTFIYLTNWGYTVLTLSFLIKAFATSRYFHWVKIEDKDHGDEEEIALISHSPDEFRGNESFSISCSGDTHIQPPTGLPWLLQFSWLLTNIATTMGIFISVFFWSAVFTKLHLIANMETIQMHAINSVLLLLDLCVSAIPIHMAHVYQPLTFGFAYASFNAIYWAAGGLNPFGDKEIYPITKWDSPYIGVTLAVALGLVIIVHGVLVLTTRGLDKISMRKQPQSIATEVI